MNLPQFETRMRGYDQQQVDTYIQDLLNQYNKLAKEANDEIAQYKQQIDSMKATMSQVSEIREHSEEQLKTAEQTRLQLEDDNKNLKNQINELQIKVNTASKRSSAWETGQQIVELAEKTKNDLIAQATEQANNLRDTSRKQAEELMQNTKDAAAQHLEEAQQKAKQLLADANEQAERIRADASAYAQKQDEIARKAISMQDEVRDRLQQAVNNVEGLVDRKPEHTVARPASRPIPAKKPLAQTVDPKPIQPEPVAAEAETKDDETQLIPVVTKTKN